MRVALLTYSTRPRGGVVHTLALAEALAARGDVEVTVVSLARGGDTGFFRPVDPSVDVHLVPFPDRDGESVGERVLRSIDALAGGFDPATVDLVHAQDCISANAFGRCVRTVHHLDRFSTPELVACHERAIVRPFAHVCVSAAVASELADGWGISAEVIPNGVEADRFSAAAGDDPAAVAARARWRERIGGPWVLSVGGIEPRKGTLDLVEAMATVQTARPGTRLVVAGGETLFDYRDYRAEVDARCAELGVEPLVLGPVDHEELPALVAASDAFAFPSTKEGFGLAAMEALAAGVPVVCRDLPVLREVFDGAARFGATPGELAAALVDALDDDRGRFADAGRSLAARHTWAAAAARHATLYRHLLTSPAATT
ncbi:MAG: MSMEG_0565 family glycosyltransferase [Actinomycetota bacterium]|nr:MSMEG_0565 family glycosyltransferase [Actinomycetota bacterium]